VAWWLDGAAMNVRPIKPDEEPLFDAMEVGEKVRAFFDTPAGKTLRHRVRESALDAINQLKSADAADAKKIRELQNEIWRCEVFIQWLSDVTIGAKTAIETMEEKVRQELYEY
jgi:hypothetical protein